LGAPSLPGGGTAGGNVNLEGNTLITGGNNASTTYAGVLRAVTPGDAQSILVRATSSRGVMYPELSGNRTAKSQVIYDWVVSSSAAQ